MITIDGKEHMTLRDVATHFNVSYQAAYHYLFRHKDIPRKCIGNTVFVRLEDFSGYKRRARRK